MATLDKAKRQQLEETRLDKLIQKIEQALTSATPKQKQKFLKKLTEFINSDNEYKKQVYQQKESQIKVLKAKLEGTTDTNDNKSLFRKEIVIPVLLVASFVIGLIIVICSQRKIRKRK